MLNTKKKNEKKNKTLYALNALVPPCCRRKKAENENVHTKKNAHIEFLVCSLNMLFSINIYWSKSALALCWFTPLLSLYKIIIIIWWKQIKTQRDPFDYFRYFFAFAFFIIWTVFFHFSFHFSRIYLQRKDEPQSAEFFFRLPKKGK